MVGDNFVPLDEDDVKHALNVPVKDVDRTKLEKIEKLGGKAMTRKDNKIKIEKPRKVKKKYDVLILTEKPQACEKIAVSLGQAKKGTYGGVGYYELSKGGKKIVVACAVGHLFTLKQVDGKGYPIFDVEWRANHEVRKRDWSKKYFMALKKLCRESKSFIVATDYDIEGEVIGLNIIRFICKEKDAGRMKFSSLTKEELEKAYENVESSLDWGQAIAGETRHYLDWFYGINLSRALMSSIKKAGNFRIMSVGRVQGPALYLIVERERKIREFKPQKYWQVFILVDGIELKYIKDITEKKELNKFKKLKGEEGEGKTTKKLEEISPVSPFDLTTLQTESYRLFKITPSRTLQIAQQLYLAGVISYPRTSSQKIPEAIGYDKILKKLDKKLTGFVKRKKPVEGKKSDPAHPSIYPTGEKGKVDGENKRVYELIVKRFINCFCGNAEVENKKIEFVVKNLKFVVKGLEIKEKGWLNVYPIKLVERDLKDLQGNFQVEKVRNEEKETKPPRRYSPASLVSELSKRNLGTKATRASIVETLYDRNYMKGQSIEATSLGMSLIETLEKYSPIIIDEKLTRKVEKEMEGIRTAKKDLEKKEEKILNEAKKIIEEISENFKKKEEEIGKDLVQANQELRDREKEESKVMKCMRCGKGWLCIKYSPKYKRYFMACDAYPDCKTTFSLPEGKIDKTDKLCEKCGFPILRRLKKGKRPWLFCFNPNCESRTTSQDKTKQDNE